MNTSVIIAAIVCITIMVIFAIIMVKKISTTNKLFSEFSYSMQSYIATIVTAADNTRQQVKNTGEVIDSRIKEVSYSSATQIKEILCSIQAIQKQAKEGIKVSVGLQAIKPAPAPAPAPTPKKANTDPKKIAKEAEKENEARKIYKRAAKLRKEGKTFATIADELGYKSARSVQRIIVRGTEKTGSQSWQD